VSDSTTSPITAAVLVALVKILTGNSVRWSGCEPSTRQRVYFANHTSHLDALVLWTALHPEARALARPVAAKDYWMADPLRRHFATRVFNAVLIDRHRVTAHAHNPIEPLLEALENGRRHSLILFPEGTRGDGPTAKPFKSGLYHLAKHRPDIELVPVLIDNMNRILPKGELLPVPLLGGLSFGAPMRVEEGEGKAPFLERARHAVESLRQV
jgi:1-acyl-sn-glycerol-3-phosphate acyltransferase